MWYTLGFFTSTKDVRLRGSHRIDRWCMLTGPHYRRDGPQRRQEMAIELAGDLAKHAGYDLESVINVKAEDLCKYTLTTFPWLLTQSSFWEGK